MRRIVLAVAAAALVAVLVAAPASAGGASLATVQDRYEPGDIATVVAYVGPGSAGGWVDDGPYFTYAEVGPNRRVPLGRLGLEPTRFGPAIQRVSLTFVVPEDVPAGHYQLVTCNAGCTKGLGELAGGTLNVGVDPVQPVVREWPPDEFEIVNLPPGARTTWPSAPAPPIASPPTTVSTPARTLPRLAQPPTPATATSHDASPLALALGGAVAAVCVGMVLVALRDG